MEVENIVSSDSNLANILFQAHKSNVYSVRTEIFSSLKDGSGGINFDAEEILIRKNEFDSNTLRFYEIFPWFLSDLTGLDHSKTHEIAVNWLSMYFYITILDDYLDDGVEIKAKDFIGTAHLAQKGLLNLFKNVCNTKYEKIFNESLLASAKYQLEDTLYSSARNLKPGTRMETSAGKNSILIICASAFAASKFGSDSILEITKELLLTVQYLDDLADFEGDYTKHNFTELLKGLSFKSELNNNQFSKYDLIEKMLLSGSIEEILKNIENGTSRAIQVVTKNHLSFSSQNPSIIYLNSLIMEVVKLRNFILMNVVDYSDLSFDNKQLIIKEIDTSIQKIYLHT